MSACAFCAKRRRRLGGHAGAERVLENRKEPGVLADFLKAVISMKDNSTPYRGSAQKYPGLSASHWTLVERTRAHRAHAEWIASQWRRLARHHPGFMANRMLRPTRLSVYDEQKNGLAYYSYTFLTEIPYIQAKIEDQMSCRLKKDVPYVASSCGLVAGLAAIVTESFVWRTKSCCVPLSVNHRSFWTFTWWSAQDWPFNEPDRKPVQVSDEVKKP